MDTILPDNFKDMPHTERLKFLRANADDVSHNETVTRVVRGDSKDSYKHEFVEQSIKLSKIEDEKKDVMSEFKDRMDPFKKRVKELSEILKTGVETITSDVYKFRDHENGRVYTILPDGEVIDDRRMLDHERQQTVQGGMRKVPANE